MIRPHIAADLLQPSAGYLGPVLNTELEYATAMVAEAKGRASANLKITTIKEILEQAQ